MPAATTRIKTPVQRKKRRRSIRTLPAKIAKPSGAGDEMPKQRAERRRALGALLEDGEQEEHGFQPLARHSEEDHADQGEAMLRRSGQRCVDGWCSSLLIERAALRIQNTMEVSTTTASSPTMASNSSCARCGNSALTSCSPAPTRQSRGDRQQHAEPDRRDPGTATRLRQIAGDDADDQGRFDSLPQHHQERDKHVKAPAGPTARVQHRRITVGADTQEPELPPRRMSDLLDLE